MTILLRGFDISAYQGDEAPVGADFVFVKATEGSGYTNGKFAAQWASAGARATVRGAYHFARPEESSYQDQAKRFLDTVQPSKGEPVALDLEASKLSQAATNAWARGWGDYVANELGEQQDAYFGSGYATNGTGKDLAKHFRHWWYPQYPSAYQLTHELTLGTVDLEARRAENRSSLVFARTRIARATSKWPPAISPWLPSNLTCGWSKPHIWQFTDNFGGLDASITALTVAELSGGATPTPMPAPQPKAWPGRYLKVKSPLMHGADVEWVQERLNRHGAHLKVDGQYGAHTRDAVEAFQKAHKLTRDGVVGEHTWNALAK